MIRIIAGGKPSKSWILDGVNEYERRLRKPFDVKWEFMPEDKLEAYLAKWPFHSKDFVIVLDERGEIISSPELSKRLDRCFTSGRDVVMIIGGAYGIVDEVREKAGLVWSISKLVFPHELMRVVLAEQIYRAYNISSGGKYHHQ